MENNKQLFSHKQYILKLYKRSSYALYPGAILF